MIELFKLNHTLSFPSTDFALDEPNGLLAFGGDLSAARLVTAYKQGIFPWYNAQEPILWWSPTPRAIIWADRFKANKSLKKNIRRLGYKASLNTQFNEVIDLCSSVARRYPHATQAPDSTNATHTNTWISTDMLNAYKKLHLQGYAHSVEITNTAGNLVGGLYGVVVNGIFCGESMFHLQTDASKAAFLALSKHMLLHNMSIIDCQLVNPHLESLGCVAIQRNEFLSLLKEHQTLVDCWQPQTLSLL
ncbi:MAG: leucyl/phenylalanyl-tRNA--protein transferase [Kangiellaceae bacterium]|jgi:leucyl/phenylalanyl-tRNA--protein transferase